MLGITIAIMVFALVLTLVFYQANYEANTWQTNHHKECVDWKSNINYIENKTAMLYEKTMYDKYC